MKRFLLFILAVVLVSGGVWFMKLRDEARAVTFDQPSEPETRPRPMPAVVKKMTDSRISKLKDRGDGARLLLAPEEGMTLLRAGFIDNQTMVMTATTTGAVGKGYRFFAYDLVSRTNIRDMKSWSARVSSAYRPAHKNADKFCFSERYERAVFEITCSDYAWKNPARLTTHDGPEDLVEPAISPDGGWVVFEVNTERVPYARKGESATGTSSIWKIGLNGAGLRQLTRGADDRFPTWSEDGGKIYFQRRAPGGQWDAYQMNSDGFSPQPVMRTVDEDERFPTPVGASGKIAAAVTVHGKESRIKLIDEITKAGTFLTEEGYGSAVGLSVSPDGKLVSFLAPIDPADSTRLGLWLKAIE
jgi:hypothetical protein